MLAAILLVITAVSADDGAIERELGTRIDALTAERDGALERVAELDHELATAREELLVVRDVNDDLTSRAVDLEARVAGLVDERAEALRTVDDLTAALDEARADIDVLAVSLATSDQRLQDAIAERDVLRGRFPAKFDASLGAAALVGKHDLKLSTIYCSPQPSGPPRSPATPRVTFDCLRRSSPTVGCSRPPEPSIWWQSRRAQFRTATVLPARQASW